MTGYNMKNLIAHMISKVFETKLIILNKFSLLVYNIPFITLYPNLSKLKHYL